MFVAVKRFNVGVHATTAARVRSPDIVTVDRDTTDVAVISVRIIPHSHKQHDQTGISLNF